MGKILRYWKFWNCRRILDIYRNWLLKCFWAIARMTLRKNSSHYILSTIFYNCEALAGFFVDLVFNIGTLEVFLSLEVSVFDCQRHILPRCRYSTNEARFAKRNHWEIPVSRSWKQIFITEKPMPVFFVFFLFAGVVLIP